MRNDNQHKKPLAAAIGGMFLASMALTPTTAVAEQPFSAVDLDHGYTQLARADTEGKCGEGRCGEKKEKKSEGKCGEGRCGEDKADKEGKCGEGRCGEDKADKEGKCGEGKCGEGKCGR